MSHGWQTARLVDAVEHVQPALDRQDHILLNRLRDELRASDRRYRCIECDSALTPKLPRKLDGRRAAHFSHGNGAHNGDLGCLATAEAWAMSQRHLAGIATLQRWLEEQDPESKPHIDRRLPGSSRRPDLLAWADTPIPVAVEFQVSPLGPGTVQARLAELHRVYPGAVSLWVFDRDSPHFRYATGNQPRRDGDARRVDPTPDQQVLLEDGAHIAWLTAEADLGLPYFTTFDTAAARPDATLLWLQHGVPTLSTTHSKGARVHVVEAIPLNAVRLGADRRDLMSPDRDMAMAHHQAAIQKAISQDDRRRLLQAEGAAARMREAELALAAEERERAAAEAAELAARAASQRALAEASTIPIALPTVPRQTGFRDFVKPVPWWAFWRRRA